MKPASVTAAAAVAATRWKIPKAYCATPPTYLAIIDAELCTGCGTCVDKCHTHAAYLNDDGKAARVEDHCIGCGVCAAFCPENAISLQKGERIVRIPVAQKGE